MVEMNTLPSAKKEIAPGDVILDKYRFERFLGEGGQGCVWQAQNLLLDLPVAIKIVHPDSRDRSLTERLFREARAAAMLGHPAIVRVLDLGQAPDGALFLVMELLKGESLADRLVQVGRFAPERALRVLLPIADALVAAHAHGVVHRDVKPDNVFLAITGEVLQPKLLDFGIARLMQSSPNRRALTKSGVILGTPAYLSPEQAEGLGTVDFHSDIWSFCAMAYECLSGVVPFAEAKWIDLRRRILEDEPKPLTDLGVEDTRLWQILSRGLEKAAEDRWPSMLELGRALACWLIERGVTEDICGSALSARWLRRESLAIELLAPASQVQEVSLPEAATGPSGSTSAEVRSDEALRERAFSPRAIVGLSVTAAAWALTVLFMVLGTRQAEPVPATAIQPATRSQNSGLVQVPRHQEGAQVVAVQSKASVTPAASVVLVEPVEVVGSPPLLVQPERAVPQQVAAGVARTQSQAAYGAARDPEPAARTAARPGNQSDMRVRPAPSSILGLEPLDPY